MDRRERFRESRAASVAYGEPARRLLGEHSEPNAVLPVRDHPERPQCAAEAREAARPERRGTPQAGRVPRRPLHQSLRTQEVDHALARKERERRACRGEGFISLQFSSPQPCDTRHVFNGEKRRVRRLQAIFRHRPAGQGAVRAQHSGVAARARLGILLPLLDQTRQPLQWRESRSKGGAAPVVQV